VRKIAWVLVVLLSLASAVLFLRYVSISEALGDPKGLVAPYGHRLPGEAGALLGVKHASRRQADLALYLSITTGLLAVLAFIILAAPHRRRRPDDDDEDENDDAAGLQTCPECDEPINGLAIVCRSCGHRFGTRQRSRRR
jgi:hypothetical protein